MNAPWLAGAAPLFLLIFLSQPMTCPLIQREKPGRRSDHKPAGTVVHPRQNHSLETMLKRG
jgi:hypothetical protein